MKLEEILDSKTYVKENGAITFGSPREYLEPFLEVVEQNNIVPEYEVKTANAVINQNIEDTSLNIAYPRVMIEAKFGVNNLWKSTIGIVYALEIQRPQIKVYSGTEVIACTNLTIFNASHLFSQDLLGNYKEVYAKTKMFFDDEEAKLKEYEVIYDRLLNTQLTEKELNETIGKALFNSHKTKLGTTPIVKASQYLKDPSSSYYVGRNGEFNCSMWNVYNSITQALNNADLLEKPSKTVALAKILEIN